MLDSGEQTQERTRTDCCRRPLGFAVVGSDDDSRYIYDTATNRILKVDKKIYDQIRGAVRSPGDPIADEAGDRISRLRSEYGLFCSEPPTAMAPCYTADQAEHLTSHHLGQLTMEVTESCSLRCGYYQFTHGPVECRSHGRASMRLDLVRACVDYLVAHSGHSEKRALGFYGGEPLLASSEIHAALSRLEFHGVDAHVTVTTNGTVPFRKYEDAIRNHDLSLLVSVDSPREEHDRHRCYTNGDGSFDAVMANLRELAEGHPEYYERSVAANCVLTPSADLFALREFFEEDELVGPLRVQISGMMTHEGCAQVSRNPCRPEQYAELEEEYMSALQEGERPSKFLRALFDTTYVRFFKRDIYSGFERTTGIGGMCLPGYRKIFVDCSGVLHACERVDRSLPLGDVVTGMQMDRVRAVFDRQVDLCEGHCLSCWGLRLCAACWAGLAAGTGTPEERRAEYCRTTLLHYGRMLLNVVRVLERNKQGFDWRAQVTLT